MFETRQELLDQNRIQILKQALEQIVMSILKREEVARNRAQERQRREQYWRSIGSFIEDPREAGNPWLDDHLQFGNEALALFEGFRFL